MTWTIFDQAKLKHQNGTQVLDFDTDDFRIAILTNSATITRASDTFFNGLNANEVTGTNYSANGIALANESATLASNVVTFDADDFTISQHASGFSNGRHLILLKFVNDATDSPVIAYHTEGSDFGNVAGDLDFVFPATGIIQW